MKFLRSFGVLICRTFITEQWTVRALFIHTQKSTQTHSQSQCTPDCLCVSVYLLSSPTNAFVARIK